MYYRPEQVLHSWKLIRAGEGWTQLPVVAMGASSGGSFVGSLAFYMELRVRRLDPA